jgi:hypothetical protein
MNLRIKIVDCRLVDLGRELSVLKWIISEH